jgi:hypothetical protein
MLSVSQPGQPPTGWGPAPQGWGPPPQPGPAPAYGSYGWGGPPPAPKPGVAPLRPLGVGDILEATLSILRRYPGAAFGSAAVVVGTVTLLQLAVLWPTITTLTTLPDPVDPASGQQWIDAVTELPWVSIMVAVALVWFLSLVLFTALTGLLSVIVGQAVLGRPLSFGQAWSKAGPRLPTLVVTVVLVGLLVGAVWLVVLALWALLAAGSPSAGTAVSVVLLSLAVAVPLSVFLGVRLSLATPAVMLESDAGGAIGPWTAVRRSWSLVRGGWWRTFGIVLLGGVIAGALSQVIAAPVAVVTSLAPMDITASAAASIIASGIGQAVALPISGLVLGLVYVDRRIRSEGLADSLARAAGVAPLPERDQ